MALHSFTKSLQAHQVSGDESTNVEYKSHNGSFGTYFRNKQVKLDTQAKERNVLQSKIFANCVIYITGRTNPSAQELKRIIVENGGQVCAFLGGKSYCTHIVTESLTNRKEVQYSNMKVVKPAWVTESAKLGRQQPWTNYRVLQVPDNQVFGGRSKAEPINGGSASRNNATVSSRPNLYDNWDIPEYIPFTLPSGELAPIETGETTKPSTKPEVTYDEKLLDTPGPEGDAARTAWILDQRSRVNCTDPQFLGDYFSKSRLHYLSTGKLELRHRCRKYVPPYSAEVTNTLISTQQRRTLLHIDFDSFFVAVALKRRPHLLHEPVCVSNGSDGSDIASCNYVARQVGVKNGMWVSRAKTLCPNLVCLPYDFDEYIKCSNALYEVLFSILPNKISAISVDEAIIDVTHLASARPTAEICEMIRVRVRESTGISVSVGAGNNILMAKMALRKAKPDGYFVATSPQNIQHFSVKDLPGVGHHIFAQLERLGIDTVAALGAAPLPQLQSTVGTSLGQKLYNYAHGIDSDDIDTLDVPVRTVGIEIGWGVRVINEIEMWEFVDKCGQEVLQRLDRSGQVPEVLTVKIHVKSCGSNFLTPKYMGRGLCDVQSKSKGVSLTTQNDQLLAAIHSLVRQIDCPPLSFRGIGIHMKVSDAVVFHDPLQTKLMFPFKSTRFTTPTKSKASVITPQSTPQTPKRKPMISIPPRKRHRTNKTLTQFFVGDRESRSPQKVDASVFGELPTQIRREILLNEDDYIVPQECKKNIPDPNESPPLPLFFTTKFLDTCDTSELRVILKKWVKASVIPTREDANQLTEFLITSAREDSQWVTTMELLEWLKFLIIMYVEPDTKSWKGWLVVQQYIETEIQSVVAARLARTPV